MVYNTQNYWGFRALSIVRYYIKQRTQRFGNCVCFRPQASVKTPTPLGPSERANLSHWVATCLPPHFRAETPFFLVLEYKIQIAETLTINQPPYHSALPCHAANICTDTKTGYWTDVIAGCILGDHRTSHET
jgi:hypothetical protein